MAVELEKIASLLEQAYENIESLETENTQLRSDNTNLQTQVELQKEASVAGDWDDANDMGSAVDYSSPEHHSPENKLDDFLSN